MTAGCWETFRWRHVGGSGKGGRYLGRVVGVSRKGGGSRESTFGEDTMGVYDGVGSKGRVACV